MKQRLARELLGARLPFAITVSAGLLGGFLIIVQAGMLTHIINGVFLERQSLHDVLPAIVLLIVAIGVRGALLWLAEAASAALARRIKSDLRGRLFRHLFALGPAYLKTQKTGELVTAAMEGVEQVETYLARYIPQMALAAGVPLALFCYIVTRDMLSAAILFATAPLIPFFMILIGRSAQALTTRQWKTLGVLSGHFLDILRGLTTLKLFNRSHRQIEVIAAISDAYRRSTMKSLRIAFLSAFVMELLTTLSTAMIAVALGLRLLSGSISFAPALVVLFLTPEFYLPIRMLGTQFHAGMNGVSAAESIYTILDEQPLGLIENPHGRRLLDGPHTIRFDHVSFARGDELILSDITFTLEAGETVALVGPTGAGKSTVIDLLLGFLRPSTGTILVDDVPLPDLSLSWWRQQVAAVMQHTHLFAGSLRDNLTLAKPDSGQAELIRAVRNAGVDEFLPSFPDGLLTRIGEDGARLSGGQMQRIAVARAILKDSPVWVLDEPTAHLDIDAEISLQETLEHVAQGRMKLIAAHRLNTIRRADRILVIDHGRIVEQGTHSDLMRRGGTYRRLVRASGEENAG